MGNGKDLKRWDRERVHKLDSLLLDDELVQLFTEAFWKSFSLFDRQWHLQYTQLAKYVGTALLQGLSMWRFRMPFGATMLNLALAKSSSVKKILYVIAQVLVAYLQRSLRWERVMCLASLLNFVVFLYRGDNPTLVYRLLDLCLKVKTADAEHVVETEFVRRQLLWQTLTEFALVLLPFIRRARLWSILPRIKSANTESSLSQLLDSESRDKLCTTCKCDKISLPCKLYPCGHVYCFVCVMLQVNEVGSCSLCRVVIDKVIRD